MGAALALFREKGFTATTVDDLCERAGVTKGAFFHHFKTKEDVGVAAADYWSEVTGQLFASAEYHQPKDPLDRVLAYIDFRRQLLAGRIPEFTCVVGTMVQETYEMHPRIRDACAKSIFGHADTLVEDIEQAKRERKISGDWSAESLARHTQAVIQGAFVLAKAKDDVEVAVESVDHLRRYVEQLFQQPTSERKKAK